MAIRLGHDGDEFAETHEINVTPFIDVILVLLIIFMIAAPLATVDISVDLPASSARAAMATILAGEATAAQLIGFVVALKAKGETPEEISGLLDAVLEVVGDLLLAAAFGAHDDARRIVFDHRQGI